MKTVTVILISLLLAACAASGTGSSQMYGQIGGGVSYTTH